MENKTEDNITVNGEPVAPDGSITIPVPEQPSEPSNPSFTEPCYYPDYDEDSLPPVDEEAPEEARDLYMVTCRTLNVRAGAGTNFEILGTLSRGTAVEILDVLPGWYEIEYLGGVAYVSSSYIG